MIITSIIAFIIPFLTFTSEQISSEGCPGSMYTTIKIKGHTTDILSKSNYSITTNDTVSIYGSAGGGNCWADLTSFKFNDEELAVFDLNENSGFGFKFVANPGKYHITGWGSEGAFIDYEFIISEFNVSTNIITSTEISLKPPFPNPFNSFLEIPIDPDNPPNKIIISNIQGSVIYSVNFPENDQLINLSSSENGVYLVKMVFNHGAIQHKVVKK